MRLTEKQFVAKEKLHPECVILTPWEEFSPAIEQVLNRKRIVYDFTKLVYSLAESYRKSELGDSDSNLVVQAIEWVEYNTVRSLPYFPEEFRPILVEISEKEALDYCSEFVGTEKLKLLMKESSFLEELLFIRQYGFEDFEQSLISLLKKWEC